MLINLFHISLERERERYTIESMSQEISSATIQVEIVKKQDQSKGLPAGMPPIPVSSKVQGDKKPNFPPIPKMASNAEADG